MKRKAFLTFGVIMVFTILAIPGGIPFIKSYDFVGEVVCALETGVQKLMEHLRSFALQL